MQEEPSKPAVGPSKQLFMRHTSDCSKAGFTLVELLVVIAIIGIFAAILLPALKGVTVARQRATAKMDMAKIISAIHEYQAANNVFPIAGQPKPLPSQTTGILLSAERSPPPLAFQWTSRVTLAWR